MNTIILKALRAPLFLLINCYAVALISGCATSHKSTDSGVLCSDTQLAPNMFRIVCRGNASSSSESTRDSALHRAADVAQQHGFKFFAIVIEASSRYGKGAKSPGTAITSGYIYTDADRAYFTGHTTYTPGKIYSANKPETELVVRGFQTKPEGIFTFDVSAVQQTILPRNDIR